MNFIDGLALSFWVTSFDVIIGILFLGITGAFFQFWQMRQIFEAAFWAITWMAIYLVLSVLLLGNIDFNTTWDILPIGFALFIINISIYLVFILAIIFPIHGSLVLSIPSQPIIYLAQFFIVSIYFCFTIWAVLIYTIEQTYIFKAWTIFAYLKDIPYYTEVIRGSNYFRYVMEHKDTIIPLWVLLMLYKLLLSNIINAVLLSIWYNLSHIGFYRQNENPHYRVEFHEVGAWEHDGHGDDGHDWNEDNGHKDNHQHH